MHLTLFIGLEGSAANMKIRFKRPMRALGVLALAAACNSPMWVPAPLQGQEAPSIVGSSPLYGLSGATGWINSKPLNAKELKSKVVLVDFWTYSCINCLRSLPYIEAWAQKYKESGLVVI
jgi:thiol-disulfide isomerase/thioredoxin